jgi:drug/metabolite transporter (DMT)-like permease
MLLDSFAIPAAMVISAVFLHARYTKKHGVGVLLCVTGLALTVVSDLGESYALCRAHVLQRFDRRVSCTSCLSGPMGCALSRVQSVKHLLVIVAATRVQHSCFTC